MEINIESLQQTVAAHEAERDAETRRRLHQLSADREARRQASQFDLNQLGDLFQQKKDAKLDEEYRKKQEELQKQLDLEDRQKNGKNDRNNKTMREGYRDILKNIGL